MVGELNSSETQWPATYIDQGAGQLRGNLQLPQPADAHVDDHAAAGACGYLRQRHRAGQGRQRTGRRTDQELRRAQAFSKLGLVKHGRGCRALDRVRYRDVDVSVRPSYGYF